jgi:biopolymer transport protein ExbD
MSISLGSSDEASPMADINVTPLVDVMMVLLIIFIITVPVIVQTVKLDLPKATNVPTVTKPENVNIAVDKDGNIYWNTLMVDTTDELKNELRRVAVMNPQPEVHIRGDKDTQYRHVARVLVAAQQIGIHKVGFLTEPEVFHYTRE